MFKTVKRVSLAFALVVAALALPTAAEQKAAMPLLRLAKNGAVARHAGAKKTKDTAVVAPVDLTVQASLPEKILNTIVPIVNAYGTGLTINGMSGKDYEFDSFKITTLNLGNPAASFIAPNAFQLQFQDFQLAIPPVHFYAFKKIFHHKIGCHGTFWFSTNGDVIIDNVALNDDNGRLVLAGNSGVTINYGSLNIQHKFDHEICKIGQDIIELIIGNVNTLIKNMVEKDLAPAISKAVDNALSNVLGKIPIDVTAAPVVVNDGMTIAIDGADLIKAQGVAQNAGRVPVARPVPFKAVAAVKGVSPKQALVAAAAGASDLVISIPQSSAYTLSSLAEQAGYFNRAKTLTDTTAKFQVIAPAVFNACPNCFIAYQTQATVVPTPQFATNVLQMAIENFELAISGVPQAGGAAKPLFTVGLNLTAGMNNFQTTMINGATNIKFQIAVPTIAFKLMATSVGPLDISILSGLVQIAVQDLVVPDFNANFAGITLPAMQGFGLTDLSVLATPGMMALSTDVSINL